MPEEEQMVDEGGGCESGADPGFSFGGGGRQQNMWAHAHHEREA